MNRTTYTLLSQILYGAWYLSQDAALAYTPLLHTFLSSSTTPTLVADKEKEFTASLPFPITSLSPSATSGANRMAKATSTPKVLKVISVQGTMMKYADCALGTMEMANLVSKYAADTNAAGIIMKMDTPGGMVDGLNTLVEAIKAARQSKPVYAFIEDGQCCSAGYYVAVACDKIYASKPLDIIGSIGVMISFTDMKAYYEQQGVKFHEVYASQSTEKNGIFQKALEGNYAPLQQEVLDVLADNFISHVKAHRNIDTTLANPFKGATYMAKQALKMGMIDKIAPLDVLVEDISNAYYEQHEAAQAHSATPTSFQTHHYYQAD
jgi:protease-4